MKHRYMVTMLIVGLVFFSGCGTKRVSDEKKDQKQPSVLIKDVQIKETEDYTLISIIGADELTYNVYKLDDANMVVIDLPDALFAVKQKKISLANEFVSHIALSEFSDQFSTLARMSFFFNKTPTLPSIKEDGNRLDIRFGNEEPILVGSETEPEGGQEEEEEELPGDVRINEINCLSFDHATELHLVANRQLLHYLDEVDPSTGQLSIEIPGATISAGEKISCENARFIESVSYDSKPAKLNIVLKNQGQGNFAVRPSNEGMVIAFFDQSKFRATMTALEYQQFIDYSRFTITTDQPAYAHAEYEDERTIILTLKNTDAPRRLRRIFDTGDFQGSVLALTPMMAKGSKDLRLVTKLRSPTDFSLDIKDNQILFDIKVTKTDKKRKRTEPVLAGQENVPGVLTINTPEQGIAAEMDKLSNISEEGPKTETFDELQTEDLVEIDDSDLTILDDSVLDTDSTALFEKGEKNEVQSRGVFSASGSQIIGPRGEMAGMNEGDEQKFPRYSGRKISLNFESADIRYVLKLLADIKKVNFIFDDSVRGVITVKMVQIPWDQALEVILASKQLKQQDLGNILRIAAKSVLQAEAEQELLAKVTEEKGQPIKTLLKPVNYAKAEEIANKIKGILEGKGKVEVDQRTNTLILTATEEQIARINKIVELLDTQTPQVSIEARIVEANTSFTKNFGINWSGGMSFSSEFGNPTGLFFPNDVRISGDDSGGGGNIPNTIISLLPGNSNTMFNMSLGSINGVLDIGLRLAMMESWGSGKVISSPKVTVMDNEAAMISTGFAVPFTSAAPNTGTNVQMIQANTSISVTPHVTADGAILLDINATKDAPNFSMAVSGNPSIQTNQINSTVLIKSGNTTVLGGNYEISDSEGFTGVPYLSKIPVIGWLFKARTKSDARKELLFFITPRVVKDVRKVVSD